MNKEFIKWLDANRFEIAIVPSTLVAFWKIYNGPDDRGGIKWWELKHFTYCYYKKPNRGYYNIKYMFKWIINFITG
jgi:hypothetical protein